MVEFADSIRPEFEGAGGIRHLQFISFSTLLGLKKNGPCAEFGTVNLPCGPFSAILMDADFQTQ